MNAAAISNSESSSNKRTELSDCMPLFLKIPSDKPCQFVHDSPPTLPPPPPPPPSHPPSRIPTSPLAIIDDRPCKILKLEPYISTSYVPQDPANDPKVSSLKPSTLQTPSFSSSSSPSSSFSTQLPPRKLIKLDPLIQNVRGNNCKTNARVASDAATSGDAAVAAGNDAAAGTAYVMKVSEQFSSSSTESAPTPHNTVCVRSDPYHPSSSLAPPPLKSNSEFCQVVMSLLMNTNARIDHPMLMTGA